MYFVLLNIHIHILKRKIKAIVYHWYIVFIFDRICNENLQLVGRKKKHFTK